MSSGARGFSVPAPPEGVAGKYPGTLRDGLMGAAEATTWVARSAEERGAGVWLAGRDSSAEPSSTRRHWAERRRVADGTDWACSSAWTKSRQHGKRFWWTLDS